MSSEAERAYSLQVRRPDLVEYTPRETAEDSDPGDLPAREDDEDMDDEGPVPA